MAARARKAGDAAAEDGAGPEAKPLGGRHARTYAQPRWYDVAFGYRDVGAECDFLLAEAARHLGRAPASAAELGAGPANHAVELARRGLDVQALDIEPAMVAYGLEKAARAGVAIDYREGDLARFALARPVDLALLLLNTAGCLLTQDEFVACLRAAAGALVPGGVLVVELPHPRDVFLREPGEGWEVERDGLRVRVAWGAEGDRFDPVTQVAEVTTTLTAWEGGKRRVVRDRALQRHYTAPEVAALARISGALVPAAWHGALEEGVEPGDEDRAWRLVAVLQRPLGAETSEGNAP